MLTCEDCGKTSEDVQVVIDPYSLELFGEEVEITVCDACYQDRCSDI